MEAMYIKYINGYRYSIIKEGENIIMDNSKVIPFESIKKSKKSKYEYHAITNKSNIDCNSNETIDEEITNFFFNAIHKNYLSGREK